MTMTPLHREVGAAVERVRAELVSEAERNRFPAPKFVAHPPAAQQSIAALEAHHHTILPPTYRAFLELHDGYAGLAGGGDMLSARATLPGGTHHEPVLRWKRMCADYGSAEVVDGIVIASSLQPNWWLYIDVNRPRAAGEFTLVYWMGDTTQDLGSLLDYFEFVVMSCRADLSVKPPHR
jgi:hypothetical protein